MCTCPDYKRVDEIPIPIVLLRTDGSHPPFSFAGVAMTRVLYQPMPPPQVLRLVRFYVNGS